MIKTQPAVELEHVSASLERGERVEDVSLVVQRAESVALLGGSGSGKTVALRVAAGLEEISSGTVRLLGEDPMELSEDEYVNLRRRVGVVFDRPALISNMSVFSNVALPLRYHTLGNDRQIEERVLEALREWGVEAFRDRFPAELAPADARLVAMARALMFDPEILFIDEMVIGLDAWGVARLRAFFEKMRAKGVKTIVASASAPNSLLQLMDRLLFFREGRIIAEGKPSELSKATDPTVQALFGT